MLQDRDSVRGDRQSGVTCCTELALGCLVDEMPRRLASPITGKEMLASVDRSLEQPFRLALLRHQHGARWRGRRGRTDSHGPSPSIAIVPALAGERPTRGAEQRRLALAFEPRDAETFAGLPTQS